MTLRLNPEPGTERILLIGAEAFLDLEASWEADRGSRETRLNLTDHAFEHPLIATLPIAAQYNSHGYIYITELIATVEGIGFSGLPSTPAKLRLYGRDAGTLLDVSDPSANAGALNTRHNIGSLLATPIRVSPTDKLLIEVCNAYGGAVWGTFRFWGAQVRYGIGRVEDTESGAEVYP